MNRHVPGALLRHLLWLTLAATALPSQAIQEPDEEATRNFDQVELSQHLSAPDSARR
jgi:hypothetical protein